MYPAYRELPEGARQQAGPAGIPSEQRTEPLWESRLRRFAPDTAPTSAGLLPE